MKRKNPDAILNTYQEVDAKSKSLIFFAVLFESMGYFVDIYDLLLFGIVRVPSLRSFGFVGKALTDKGVLLLKRTCGWITSGRSMLGIKGDEKGTQQFRCYITKYHNSSSVKNVYCLNSSILFVNT